MTVTRKSRGKKSSAAATAPRSYPTETVRLDSLTLLPENEGHPRRNVRLHSDYQIAELTAAIKRFGFTDNIVIDKKGLVLSGNARVKAAMQAGMVKIEAKWCDVAIQRWGNLTGGKAKRVK